MNRLGIVGFGALGSFYARMIGAENRVEGLTVGAICDIDSKRRELAASLYPNIPVYNNMDEMLASGNCDFISVAVPHYLHPELTMKALNFGMPVIVEKPAGIIPATVKEMNACAAEHSDIPFGIMLNQRTNPIFKRIHEITASGELGQLRQVVWVNRQFRTQNYYNSGTWRATWGGEGGGVLVNQAPHQIDLLQWMFGMPKTVFATTNFGFHRNIAVENDVCAQFTYPNGATGVFITCTDDILGEDRLTAVYDRGRLRVLEGKRLEIERLCDDEEKLGTEYSDEALAELRKNGKLYTLETFEKDKDPFANSEHAKVFKAFSEHLNHPEKPLVANGVDGICGVTLAAAIQLSGWTKQPVDIPFDDNKYLSELNRRIAEEGKYQTR